MNNFRKTLLIYLIFQTVFSFGQIDSSSKCSKSLFYSNFLVPTTTIGLGLYSRLNNVPLNKYSIRNFRTNQFGSFHSSLDDYFQYVPIGLVYGLNLTPLESKSDFLNQTILLAKSELLMTALVFPTKYLIGDKRPDGSARNSFPSGHTTQAFVAAHFLYKEYGKKYPIIGIVGYAFAVSTAVFRVLNDRHWSADVLAGAGIGILSVNLVYLTHKYKFGKRKNTNLPLSQTKY